MSRLFEIIGTDRLKSLKEELKAELTEAKIKVLAIEDEISQVVEELAHREAEDRLFGWWLARNDKEREKILKRNRPDSDIESE